MNKKVARGGSGSRRPKEAASHPAPASLQVLADHLNVSKTTVSRALNGYADIAEETRARVRAAAEAFQYEPSTQARRLARGTSESIGLVLPASSIQLMSPFPFLDQLLAGLSDALAGHGYDLIVRVSSDESELEDYRRLWLSRKVDGFVLTRTRIDDARVDYLLEAGVPFVTHGRTSRSDEHAWLEIDTEQAFLTVTEHLIRLGHRRIAHITAGPQFVTSYDRRRGYETALRTAGLVVDPALTIEGDLTSEAGRKGARELLGRDDPPTALVCANDSTALGAMASARDMGLEVPGDVSIVGYDGITVGELFDPPLTTMTQDGMRAGVRLAQMLTELIRGAKHTACQELWRAELVRRGSDGPPGRTA